MLTQKEVKQWVKDNKKFIGFTQFYFAPHKTFKEVYMYHYKNENWDREIKRASYDMMVETAQKYNCKLKCTKQIFKKEYLDTPPTPRIAPYKQFELYRKEHGSIKVIMPDGREFLIKQQLKPKKIQKRNYDANEQLIKYITSNRFETTEVKKAKI